MDALTVIEMVAYQSAHITSEMPWRCMVCERLTPHTDADIYAHLRGAHNLPAVELTKDKDAIFHAPQPIDQKEIN